MVESKDKGIFVGLIKAIANHTMHTGAEFDNAAPMLEITHSPMSIFTPIDMTLSAELVKNTKEP